MPIGASFGDNLSLTFYCTAVMAEKWFFDAWQSYISDPNTYYMNYYDNYIGRILVIQFNDTNSPVYGAMFTEVYPAGMDAMPLSYTPNEGIHKLTIKFNYRKWYNAESGIVSLFNPSSGIGAFMENPGSFADIVFRSDGSPVPGALGDMVSPTLSKFASGH